MLDVMNVHHSQSEVGAQLFLPVQHVVCYLNEVLLSFIVPVQLLVQERVGTGREGWKIMCCTEKKKKKKKHDK